MFQASHGAGFAVEAGDERFGLGVVWGQDFDGHVAAQGGLVGLVHRGHTPSSQFLPNFVLAQGAAN